MRPLLLTLLCACTGELPTTVGRPTGGVLIAVGATRPDLDTFDIDRLEAYLDSVVLDDIGPQGRESVSVLVGYTFRPLGDTDAFGFELLQGPHRNVHISLHFGWAGEPGFLLEARTDSEDDDTGSDDTGDDDDDDDTGSDDTEGDDTDGDGESDESVALSLEVDTLTLEFDLGDIEIGAAPTTARLQIDPGAWIQALGVTPGDGTVSIGPDSGERYTQLLEAITSSTTLVLQPLPSELADEQAP